MLLFRLIAGESVTTKETSSRSELTLATLARRTNYRVGTELNWLLFAWLPKRFGTNTGGMGARFGGGASTERHRQVTLG